MDGRPQKLEYATPAPRQPDADPFVIPWWATWRGVLTITAVCWMAIGVLIWSAP